MNFNIIQSFNHMSKNLITLQAQRLKSILIRSNGWDYKGRICICYQLMIRQSNYGKLLKKILKKQWNLLILITQNWNFQKCKLFKVTQSFQL